MGAVSSHEPYAAGTAPNPAIANRRPLGPRPTNVRNITSATTNDVTVPDSAIFGAARDVRPIEYRPPVQQTEIVPNVVSLKKSSLRLVRSAADPFIYLLHFEFDASVDGAVTIYYCAKEVVVRKGSRSKVDTPVVKVSYDGRSRPAKTKFSAGMSQTYRQKEGKGLDVRQFTTADMTYKKGDKQYPIVIRLEAFYPQDTHIPENMRVRSQVTFASLTIAEGVHEPQIIAQQVLVGGTIYRIQDLYGIGSGDVTATKENVQEDGFKVDTGHECVICLTEPCNTAVLPCNHLCLCDDCGRILCTDMDYERRKCPVCRTQLGSLLRIIPSVALNGENNSEENASQATESNVDNSSPTESKDTVSRDSVSVEETGTIAQSVTPSQTTTVDSVSTLQESTIAQAPPNSRQQDDSHAPSGHDSDNVSNISTTDSSQPAAGTIERNSNEEQRTTTEQSVA